MKMKSYAQLSALELKEELELLQTEYMYYNEKKLALNMARGKPSNEQLALSKDLLDIVNSSSALRDEQDNIDCSNYGELKGTSEARSFFGNYMGVTNDEVIVVGSASLTFMYDCLSRAMLKGVLGSEKPWIHQKPKFLCPVPGYDRHFSICEFLGVEMIPIPMDEHGPNMIYLFGSTSKITFPGAGVAVFAASEENIAFTEQQLSMQAISWDKINMLRHVRFLKDMDGVGMHMEKYAEILRPKFEVVNHTLEEELVARNIGAFIKPLGGYFVTYLAPKGCAKRIVSLCKEMGVVLTAAGATHPYGDDPDDSYIRIAPSFPTVDELKEAMAIFCIAAQMSYIENKLEDVM